MLKANVIQKGQYAGLDLEKLNQVINVTQPEIV